MKASTRTVYKDPLLNELTVARSNQLHNWFCNLPETRQQELIDTAMKSRKSTKTTMELRYKEYRRQKLAYKLSKDVRIRRADVRRSQSQGSQNRQSNKPSSQPSSSKSQSVENTPPNVQIERPKRELTVEQSRWKIDTAEDTNQTKKLSGYAQPRLSRGGHTSSNRGGRRDNNSTSSNREGHTSSTRGGRGGNQTSTDRGRPSLRGRKPGCLHNPDSD